MSAKSNALTADVVKIPVNKLIVKEFYDSRTRSSFCWHYFGYLVHKEGNKKKILNSDYVYCSVCLNMAKVENEEKTFGSASVKSYNLTVSTGNLARHLRDCHKIIDQRDSKHGQPTLKELRRTPSVSKTFSAKDQWTLAKDLALLCCRSLIPFDVICDNGMADFLLKYQVIKPEDMPSQDVVSSSALVDIYDKMLHSVRKTIADDISQHAALTFEIWSDVRRKLDYITLTLHYLSNDFELKMFYLSTNIVTGHKISEKALRIKNIIEEVSEIFLLVDKNIHAVSNDGVIENHVVALANIPHHVCLGHGLQNLIWTDGIHEVQELKNLVLKLVNVVRDVCYRMNDVEPEYEAETEMLDELNNIVDIMNNGCDLALRYDSYEPVETSNHVGYIVPEGKDEIKKELLQDIPENETVNIAPLHWHCILDLAEKFERKSSHNRVILNKMLIRVGQDDTVVTPSEWTLLEELINILRRFREAVSIISTQTCTLNVALVFRSEIIDILNTSSPDDSVTAISKFKENMLLSVQHRIPVTRVLVAAALLDGRFMSLKEVDNYLDAQNTTRVAFLSSFIREVINDDEIPDIKPKPSPSTSNAPAILVKLSQKHRGSTQTNEDDPIAQECSRYLASVDPKDPKDGDLLSFWKKRQDTFPWLAAFAKSILCIPATSASCDSVFNGRSLIEKKSRLSPNIVNKVLFVHNNYNSEKIQV